MTSIEVSKRTAAITGLRELADFLDRHPDIPLAPQTYNSFVSSHQQLCTIARSATWQKAYEGNYFVLRYVFSGHITLDVYTDRQTVCRRVVIGKHLVPAMPAQPAREEDTVEWVCDHESLFSPRMKPQKK